MRDVAPLVPTNANVTALYSDISDALHMLALRASSVLGMYDFSASWSVTQYWTSIASLLQVQARRAARLAR